MTVKIAPVENGVPQGKGRARNPVVQTAVASLLEYYHGGGEFPIQLQGLSKPDGIRLRRSAIWKQHSDAFKLTVSWKGVYVSLNGDGDVEEGEG